jgi:translation initiation factor 1 (eIF-1/SUI1)
VEGVLELQGSHSDKILEYLKSKGYSSALLYLSTGPSM